ncbi:MAG: Hsp20/alpha crystallin family protein [Deltaproteobacteria bacterium]
MSFGISRGFPDPGNWPLAVDIFESEKEVLVYMDVSGVDPEKLTVVLEKEKLIVSGEREFPVLDLCCVHQLEIDYGPFQRSVTLPVPVEAEAVTSVCRHGLLVVRLPKRKTGGRIRIPIS